MYFLGAVLLLAGAIWMTVNAAKKDGALAAIFCFICGFYTIYYGIKNFAENKIPLIMFVAGLVLCLGPAPASMARLAGRERAQLLLQSARRAPLHALLSALCAELDAWAKPFGSSLRWSLDVDPQEV